MSKQPTRPLKPSHPKPQSVPIREGGGNKGITRPPRIPNPPKK